jgi:hypothetical protein
MKANFTSIYEAISPAEQKAFCDYVDNNYATQKAIRAVLETEKTRMNTNTPTTAKDLNTLNALSDLKKWLIEFLTIQELKQGLKNNSPEAQFLTLQAYQKRKIDHAFTKKAEDMTLEWAKHESPDMWQMLWQMRLMHIKYFNTEIDRLKDYKTEMTELLNGLDSFYVATKLKYAVEIESREAIRQEQYNMRLMDKIIVLSEQDTALSPAIKKLYLPLLNLTKNKCEIAFKELETFLQKSQGHERSEKLAVLLYLLNFAIHQIRNSNKAYYIDKYFELVQIGLDESLFISFGYFPTTTFLNIVNMGSHLEGYKWVEVFIEEWSKYLEPQSKEMTKVLAKARVKFEQKQYNVVLDLVNDVKDKFDKNIVFNTHIRLLELRTYYEQDEPSGDILNALNAFEQYVNRNITGKDSQKSYLRFIKILRDLVKNKDYNELVNELNKDKPLILKKWLESKIEEQKT